MTLEQMLRQADERATTLVYKGNIGDRVLLMKSGLVTVYGTKSGDRHLKIRVALFNNKRYVMREITVWKVIQAITEFTQVVSDVK